MLTIELNTGALEEQLEKMEERLKEFPRDIAEELTEWQTEDMKRRYPNTEQQENYAQTSIWPTSRAVERDEKKIKKALQARKKLGRGINFRPRSPGQRPILRHHLFDMLAWRMRDLMKEKLGWQ